VRPQVFGARRILTRAQDYINVNNIHNATFAAQTTSQQLAVARDLAN
jgi:hypothetical protein